MSYQPFLIAPFTSGEITSVEPWMAPVDAFSEIINGHIRHGVLEKRNGYNLFGKIVHGHSVNWAISGITQANPGVVTVTSTSGLSNGNTVTIQGVAGMTEVNGGEFTVSNITPTTFEIGIDTSGYGAYAGGGNTYLIPGNKTMGIYQYENSSGDSDFLAFDTKRACIYDSVTGAFSPLDDNDIFDSSADNFVWAENWSSIAGTASSPLVRLYFTNGKIFDGTLNGIRYYNGGSTTTSFTPSINGTATLNGCKLIFAIKQRLLLLYTFEGSNNYPQRMRWCQIQNPDDSEAWYDSIAGKGGYVDAPTGDHIVSAKKLKDVIIVYFTNSVWMIQPVSDPALPFVWKKLNDFRACDAKMGSIGYDQFVGAIGRRGITATDGNNTRRIDEKIENFVIEKVNQDYYSYITTGRDYEHARSWLLYPKTENPETNAALIMDEENLSFSHYDIDLKVVGYGTEIGVDYSAQDFTASNNLDIAAGDLSGETALSYYWTGNADLFLGGDTQGNIYRLGFGLEDNGSPISFQITSSAWNPFKEQNKEARFGFIDFYIDSHPNGNFTVYFYKNNDQNPYRSQKVDMLPNTDYITDISNITIKTPATSGISVTAPSHGLSDGDKVYLYGVEGMEEANNIEFSVTVTDENNFDIAVDASSFSSYTGSGTVNVKPLYMTKIWKRAYAGGIGYQHKIKVVSENNAPIKIHAFLAHFKPTGRRIL